MRWINLLPLLLATGVGCQSSATTGQDANGEADKELLQGVWVAESYEYNGKPVGEAVLRRTRVVFEGDTLELIETAEVGELVTFVLREDADPKQIDLRIARGPDAGKLALGIYRLDRDILRLCWAAPGKPRPTAFTTLNGMAVAGLVLRRLGESE